MQHAAGHEVDGTGGGDVVGGAVVLDGDEVRPSVSRGEPLEEQAGRALGNGGRARPEERLAGVEAVVGDGGVVGAAPAEARARLVEDLAGVVGRVVAGAAGELGPEPQLGAGVAGWVDRLARRTTRPSSVVMVPSSSAHCVTGSTTSARSAVSEGTTSATTRRSRRPRASRTTETFGADTTGLAPWTRSALGPPSVPSRRSRLDRRHAGAGGGVDAPDRGDVLAGRRVGDHPVPGQLVALEPVLAPALAVALPGERAVARPEPADEAERDGEVDGRRDAVGALGRLLHAPAGQHVRAAAAVHRRRGREPTGRGAQHVGGDAAHRLGALGPPPRDRREHGVPAGRALAHVLLVDEALVGERCVRARRTTRSVPGTGARRSAPSSVSCAVAERRGDDDQPTPPRPGEVLDEWRHRRGGVRADDEHGIRAPRSASGKVRPRSTPRVRLAPAAAADDMQNRPL